ncbi:MAG: hypothetical protein WA726_00870 [Acidimicrobiia bacterium]
MDQKATASAEEAIHAVGRGDVAAARTAVNVAYGMDHTLGAFVDAIYLACSEIEEDDKVSTATWNGLADSVPPGPLQAAVESNRD